VYKRQVLNHADLSLADGFGLKCAGLVKGRWIHRHTGADLVTYLLRISSEKNLKVGIINWRHGLSKPFEIETTLKKLYPNLMVRIIEADRGEWSPDLTALKLFQPDILFCALGAPFQDELLHKILPSLTAKIGIGIGGSFDYLTGKAQRSPIVFRKLGLEWIWRLVINPRLRAKRIFNAVIKFPFLFILDDLIHPFMYRPNVVAFIHQDDEVLIVNSAKEVHDFWKLPQGGRETNEDATRAIKREMHEELELHHYQISAIFHDIFKYTWPAGYSLRGYKGQRQTLCIINYLGKKDAIRLNYENRAYKWVSIDNLINEVDPVFKTAYTLFIAKFKEKSS